jgi:hypothetical protein
VPRFLSRFRRERAYGYRILPIALDGAEDESGSSSHISHTKLGVGDRVLLRPTLDLWQEYEVIERRAGLGDRKLTFLAIGDHPSRIRWDGTLVCQLVG